MQERQVTIAEETYKLPAPFLVIATQNPLEQEGTYPLPEAQLDRFLFKTVITYPSREEEIRIMKQQTLTGMEKVEKILAATDILAIRETIRTSVYVDEKIYDYVRDIVFATREPGNYGLDDIAPYISCGASPRASIALISAAKVLAFMNARDYVIPEDIKELALDVLRHRIPLTYEAIGENISSDTIIKKVLDNVIVP